MSSMHLLWVTHTLNMHAFALNMHAAIFNNNDLVPCNCKCNIARWGYKALEIGYEVTHVIQSIWHASLPDTVCLQFEVPGITSDPVWFRVPDDTWIASHTRMPGT